jgi:hypothetical protein
VLHERVLDLTSSEQLPSGGDAEATEIDLLSLPKDIATLQRLRASAYAGLPNLTRVPTDVFVWRAGEPTQRAVTKIAGLPYRPAGRPLPLAPSGEPLTFVTQICFADSRELVPPLPGDVLLIFATGKPSPRRDDGFALDWGTGLTFEWTTLGDFPLVEAAVLQWVLRLLDKNWQSFFAVLAAWQEDPSSFLGRPKLPGYKDKQHGRNLLVYTSQALSIPALRQGLVCPKLGIAVQTKQRCVQQVRIIPRIGFYVVEVIYDREPVPAAVNPALHAGADIGLNTLAMLTSDKPGFVPRVVNGRPVKSINQFYN